MIRLYLRRSESDGQEYSLTTQRAGAIRWIAGSSFAGDPIVDYVDDGLAGDDFTRPALRKLIAETQVGDVIVCRDQSRVGREAVEVTVALRELVQRRRARVFYYSSGQEVRYNTAIDAATVMIQGVGHQMELEAIRSRTREALRERVRAGRIAGGRCYGYRLERRTDGTGTFTAAVVDQKQAEIVRRVFREYLSGRGIKAIATALNRDRVPLPERKRNGQASWAPTMIRPMLMNERYRGVYTHGKIRRTKKAGKRVAERADAADVIRVDVPEWRIVDDDVWFAVSERFAQRANGPRPTLNAVRFALSGIARCAECGGPIAVKRTVVSADAQRTRVPAYGCAYHRERGTCRVTVAQPVDLVEAALADWLRTVVLSADVIDAFVEEMRAEIHRQASVGAKDVAALEAERTKVAKEKGRLIKLAAATDDADVEAEVVARSKRLRALDAEISAARKTPAAVKQSLAAVEAAVRTKLDNLGAALAADRAAAREVFAAVFPDGLRFAAQGSAFRVTGAARLESALREVTPPGIEPGIAP